MSITLDTIRLLNKKISCRHPSNTCTTKRRHNGTKLPTAAHLRMFLPFIREGAKSVGKHACYTEVGIRVFSRKKWKGQDFFFRVKISYLQACLPILIASSLINGKNTREMEMVQHYC